MIYYYGVSQRGNRITCPIGETTVPQMVPEAMDLLKLSRLTVTRLIGPKESRSHKIARLCQSKPGDVAKLLTDLSLFMLRLSIKVARGMQSRYPFDCHGRLG